MTNNNTKTIISLCPFQTQLVVQIPLTKGQIVTGPVPSPQILKVQCDRDKCQLWDRNSSVCAVSAVPLALDQTTDSIGDLTLGIRDIVEAIQDIKTLLVNILPNP